MRLRAAPALVAVALVAAATACDGGSADKAGGEAEGKPRPVVLTLAKHDVNYAFAEVPPDTPGAERRPCPNCGSLRRSHETSGSLTLGVTMSAEGTVERGVNEARMAAFALIFATALGVGLALGFGTSPLIGVLAGVAAAFGTALLLAAIYRVRVIRHLAMELMHRITGQ